MLRNTLAVLAGYATMFLIVALGLTGAYFAMGADNAFKPGTYDITTIWLVTMEAIGLLAAALAGITCAKISKHSQRAVLSLIALAILLSAVNITTVALADTPAPEDSIRAQETSNWDAMIEAGNHMPLWVTLLDPIVGTVGLLIGVTLVRPKQSNSSEP